MGYLNKQGVNIGSEKPRAPSVTAVKPLTSGAAEGPGHPGVPPLSPPGAQRPL